jgi:hypothetical protein
MDILLGEVLGEVLGVNVVVDFAEVTLVTGLVADNLDAVGIAFGLESTGSRGRVLEADEAVATGLVIGVQRDLQRLDVAIALEVLFELLRRQLLGNSADEDVVIDNLLRVGAEEVIVERKGS